MTKPVKKIEARRASLDLPKFAMEARPERCHLSGLGHPPSHWISVHETLVPCVVTQP